MRIDPFMTHGVFQREDISIGIQKEKASCRGKASQDAGAGIFLSFKKGAEG